MQEWNEHDSSLKGNGEILCRCLPMFETSGSELGPCSLTEGRCLVKDKML